MSATVTIIDTPTELKVVVDGQHHDAQTSQNITVQVNGVQQQQSVLQQSVLQQSVSAVTQNVKTTGSRITRAVWGMPSIYGMPSVAQDVAKTGPKK